MVSRSVVVVLVIRAEPEVAWAIMIPTKQSQLKLTKLVRLHPTHPLAW